MKKVSKILLIVVIALLLIVAGYVVYVFTDYVRIEDKLELTPKTIGVVNDEVAIGETYKIMTYNIGFGAYTTDYSFFMDGGKSSWAASEEGLKTNINSIGNLIRSYETDFAILQEVDIDATRTYHVNEYEQLQGVIGEGEYVFSQNFDSPFLMWPPLEPHGANKSGLVTISQFDITDSLRRSLPVSDSFTKIFDLDRCYSISRIPTDNGKELCIYDVHLSAYGADDSVRAGQLEMLFGDMKADYDKGNYVIVGGDFNHNLRDDKVANAPEWAGQFPKEQIPNGFSPAFDIYEGSRIDLDTCRDSNEGYQKGHTFTVMVDGFFISDNVQVVSYENIANEFELSDHNPVVMEFVLK